MQSGGRFLCRDSCCPTMWSITVKVNTADIIETWCCNGAYQLEELINFWW